MNEDANSQFSNTTNNKEQDIKDALEKAKTLQEKSEKQLQQIIENREYLSGKHQSYSSDSQQEKNIPTSTAVPAQSSQPVESTPPSRATDVVQDHKNKADQIVKEVINKEDEAKNAVKELRDTSKATQEKIDDIEQDIEQSEKKLNQKIQSQKGSALKVGGYKVSDLAMTLIKPPEPDPGYEPEPDPELVKEYRKVKIAKEKIQTAKKEIEKAVDSSEKFYDEEEKRIEKLDETTDN
jgi:hypothetical protein